MTSLRRRTRSPRGSGELLADEIIDSATALLLEKEDAEAVSVRAVASRVGVTPPSIYLHFADKEALLDAVCARYFEQLDVKITEAAAGITDPLRRALSQGMAYVRFAVATPVLYRNAFHRITPDSSTMVEEVLAASAFVQFSATVAELAEAGLFAESEVGDVVLEFWAAAHGIASLMIAKPRLGWGDDFQRAESMLRSVCLGRAVIGVVSSGQTSKDKARAVQGLITELGTPDRN